MQYDYTWARNRDGIGTRADYIPVDTYGSARDMQLRVSKGSGVHFVERRRAFIR